jgi:electron transport complex protein RnfB
MSLIQRIDALLPQTQCGKCGHPGCKPYAEGLARGEAINKCPPGGDETIAQLALLLAVPVIALDTARGSAPAQVAFIREAECIGCTKCIQACPVDAIVGAAKLMHTVIVDECTGCDLCVAPCPVDCIDMRLLPLPGVVPMTGGISLDTSQRLARTAKRNNARHRFEARAARIKREEDVRQAERSASAHRARAPVARLESSPTGTFVSEHKPTDPEAGVKQARINVAMSRAQLNKSLKAFGHPPVAEQAARLVELQKEFEAAERTLLALQESDHAGPEIVMPRPTAASPNRAKIQLAMARAALKKAITLAAPDNEIAVLEAAVNEAVETLRLLDVPSNDSTL